MPRGPRTNSDAAFNSFIASAPAYGIEDFESFPPTTGSSLFLMVAQVACVENTVLEHSLPLHIDHICQQFVHDGHDARVRLEAALGDNHVGKLASKVYI